MAGTARSRRARRTSAEPDLVAELLPGRELDRLERAQLAEVLRACRESRSLSEAGRLLFAVSRRRRTTSTEGDRLRKVLASQGLDFERVAGRR